MFIFSFNFKIVLDDNEDGDEEDDDEGFMPRKLFFFSFSEFKVILYVYIIFVNPYFTANIYNRIDCLITQYYCTLILVYRLRTELFVLCEFKFGVNDYTFNAY